METADSIGRWTLRVGGIGGFVLFTFFLVLTFHRPAWVEDFARGFIEREVRARVDAEIAAIAPPEGGSLLESATREIYRRNSQRIDELKTQLRDRSQDLVLVALDRVRNLDCECRRRLEQRWRHLELQALAQLVSDNERIQGFIQNGYMQVVHELQREIRIFAGTNASCFLLLILVSFGKPAATRHLLFPGVLLLAATSFCAWAYLVSQDWLLTLIHGSYVGYAYVAYVGVVLLFLCDIAFNRGRATSAVVNGAASSVGSAFSLPLC
jgi:hypothetical protein